MTTNAKFCIRVLTGNRKGAGSDATISLIIIGTKGQTKPLVLKKWCHNAFWAGSEDKYVMEAMDVGDILMIKVKNDQGGFFHRSSDLFLDEVSINYESDPRRVYEFPCYCWVQSESVIFEGKGEKLSNERRAIEGQLYNAQEKSSN